MPAKVLLSYRRSDSAAIVGRIYDRLIARYGRDAVFLDIDSIPYAKDFRDHVRETVRESAAVLAVVGPQWRGVAAGRARIMEDDDPVRVEIELALAENVPVFPLLVAGASMPGASDLPKTLERFPYLNAVAIDSGLDFHHHVDRLTASLDATLGFVPPAPPAVNRQAAVLTNPSTWAILALVSVATVAGFAGFAPPWPPGAGPIAGVFAAVMFVAADLWLRRGRGSAANVLMAASLLVLAAAGCGYLIATSEYVFAAPDNERFAKGFVCTADAHTLYEDACPRLGLDELRGAEYVPERLWTAESIAIVRVALNGLWLVTLGAFAAVLAGLRAKFYTPAGGRE